MKCLLITGGAGFIGSNFIKYILDKYNDYKVINVDSLTYAGNLENLKGVEGNPNYVFIHEDICNRSKMDEVFADYRIDYVVNFAAETHVDRSIEEPDVFIRTNVLGTQSLLDAAKKHWKIRPEDKYSKEYKDGVKFVQVSTDEVYGALGAEGKFTEETPLLPNSPYSASKASGDLMVRAYYKTYGLPVNITRCSNNYGPYQFPEKLIPLMINNCMEGKELPVYGDGMQVRDWLHVHDHCSAVDAVLQMGRLGEGYNIGGGSERTNIEIVRLVARAMGKSEDMVKYVKDRPGHDRRYAIDCTKITSELKWKPSYTFEEGIAETIQWYVENTDWVENVVTGEYSKYYKRMYDKI